MLINTGSVRLKSLVYIGRLRYINHVYYFVSCWGWLVVVSPGLFSPLSKIDRLSLAVDFTPFGQYRSMEEPDTISIVSIMNMSLYPPRMVFIYNSTNGLSLKTFLLRRCHTHSSSHYNKNHRMECLANIALQVSRVLCKVNRRSKSQISLVFE